MRGSVDAQNCSQDLLRHRRTQEVCRSSHWYYQRSRNYGVVPKEKVFYIETECNVLIANPKYIKGLTTQILFFKVAIWGLILLYPFPSHIKYKVFQPTYLTSLNILLKTSY